MWNGCERSALLTLYFYCKELILPPTAGSEELEVAQGLKVTTFSVRFSLVGATGAIVQALMSLQAWVTLLPPKLSKPHLGSCSEQDTAVGMKGDEEWSPLNLRDHVTCACQAKQCLLSNAVYGAPSYIFV